MVPPRTNSAARTKASISWLPIFSACFRIGPNFSTELFVFIEVSLHHLESKPRLWRVQNLIKIF